MKPRLLDLFCGAGGSAVGYHRAGFEVVGVDHKPQKNYPFEFHCADAFAFLEKHGHEFDVIHASPPCQAYSSLKGLTAKYYPRWIEYVRDELKDSLRPYIIENVVGADLESPFQLCGSSFGLGVRRHRLFECSRSPALVPICSHRTQPFPLDVTGTGGPSKKPRMAPGGGLSRKPSSTKQAGEAMGIDWMSRGELSQAIPPAYTFFIGQQMLSALEVPDGSCHCT